MDERQVVAQTERPLTVPGLVSSLQELGLSSGMTLLVHASLSRLGWVCGGAPAVVSALLEVLGESGTLVMPTHSSQLSDPVHWQEPPVPTNWWPVIREQAPPYDARTTPTRGMGAIAEVFRSWPGTERSAHPLFSFAARGALASEVITAHAVDFGLGERSPLARLYDVDAHVLLLGVGFDRNTSLHLAEYRASGAPSKLVKNGAPMVVDGRRVWVEIQDRELFDGDFQRLGEAFCAATEDVGRGWVGQAEARRMPQRALVDFATGWFERHR